jgi:hypothetical protein
VFGITRVHIQSENGLLDAGSGTTNRLYRCDAFSSRPRCAVVQYSLRGIEKLAQAKRYVLDSPIDEEPRCASHTAALTTRNVLSDPLQVDLVAQFGREASQVEAQMLGIAVQVLQVEVRLLFEQQPVHFPEPALGSGTFSRLRRLQCMGMDSFEREMPEAEANPVAKPLEKYLNG